MRYLMIDRVLRLERDESVRAIKNVALSEDVFSDHFPGAPVMPGSLLIEAAAQAGTALLEVSRDFQRKALLAMVDRAKFRAVVRPGDQLIIDARLLSESGDACHIATELRVGEVLVMDAKLIFKLESATRYYPERMRQFVESGYEIWLQDAEMVGFE
jgi:3-hydroxyacyl-[acyl-carrier-protein] dehydratase